MEVLALTEANKKYPHLNFYSNYYEGQSNNIYISIPLANDGTNVTYFLMYGNKIVSTLPTAAIDGKLLIGTSYEGTYAFV